MSCSISLFCQHKWKSKSSGDTLYMHIIVAKNLGTLVYFSYIWNLMAFTSIVRLGDSETSDKETQKELGNPL